METARIKPGGTGKIEEAGLDDRSLGRTLRSKCRNHQMVVPGLPPASEKVGSSAEAIDMWAPSAGGSHDKAAECGTKDSARTDEHKVADFQPVLNLVFRAGYCIIFSNQNSKLQND